MKFMRPPLVAIFFMTYFHRARGGMAPSPPPDPLLSLRLFHLTSTKFHPEKTYTNLCELARSFVNSI